MANIKLEEIVAGFSLANNLGKAEYAKLYQMGIQAIKALNTGATGQSKSYDIPLDRKLTGNLPADFVNDIRVHVPGDKGAGLLKDNNLNNYDDEEDEECCDEPDFDCLVGTDEPTRGNQGINWIGKYRIDRERNKIYVNPDFCYSCVTMVYLPSAKATKGGSWMVDELALEAVEAYIRWKYNLGRSSVGSYDKTQMQRSWLNEKRNLRYKMANITRSQLQEAARAGSKFKVKF